MLERVGDEGEEGEEGFHPKHNQATKHANRKLARKPNERRGFMNT